MVLANGVAGIKKYIERLSMPQLVAALKPALKEVSVLSSPVAVKNEDSKDVDRKNFESIARAMERIIESMKADKFNLQTDILNWDKKMQNKIQQYGPNGLLQERHFKAMFDQLLDLTGPNGCQVFYQALDLDKVRDETPTYLEWRKNFIEQIQRHRRVTVTDLLEVRHRPGQHFSAFLQTFRAKIRDLDCAVNLPDYLMGQLYFRALCEPYRNMIHMDFTSTKVEMPKTLAAMHDYVMVRFQPDIGDQGHANDASSFANIHAPSANVKGSGGGAGKNGGNKVNNVGRREDKGSVAGAADGGASNYKGGQSRRFEVPFPAESKIADAAAGGLRLFKDPHSNFVCWATADGKTVAPKKDNAGKWLQQCCGVYVDQGASHQWNTCQVKVNPRHFKPKNA
jgi:hypothetical protein